MKPYAAEVVYNYKSTSPHELSVYSGQLIQLAPREVQQTHKLLNTGWALGTVDNKTSGLIPINYVRRVGSKPFASETNEPVIEPEIPMPDIQNDADKSDQQTETICIDSETYEKIASKMPPNSNEIVNESPHIDPIIKDL